MNNPSHTGAAIFVLLQALDSLSSCALSQCGMVIHKGFDLHFGAGDHLLLTLLSRSPCEGQKR